MTSDGFCPFAKRTLLIALIACAAAWIAWGLWPAVVLVLVLGFIESIAEDFYRGM